MNTRCKPGDRALVWRNTIPLQCHCTAIGHVVTVTTSHPLTALGPMGFLELGVAWRYVAPLIPCGHGGPIECLLDADLVPLPPEDEIDRFDKMMERCDFSSPEGVTPVEADSV